MECSMGGEYSYKHRNRNEHVLDGIHTIAILKTTDVDGSTRGNTVEREPAINMSQ